MRIPFDSLCLSAVLHELNGLVGAKVQKWVQVNPTTIVAEIYSGGAHYLWLSWDAQFARLTLGPAPRSKIEVSPFVSELRRRTLGGRLVAVRQIGYDRIAELDFSSDVGSVTLIAELMGKHSNLMIVDENRELVGAAKWIGAGKTRRPILPGKRYELPPTTSSEQIRSLDEDSLETVVSPFLSDLLENGVLNSEQVIKSFSEGAFEPRRVPSLGVYPLPTGLPGESPLESYGLAAEAWFQQVHESAQVEQARTNLAVQLQRVKLAREVALSGLFEAADTARRATELQQTGELILAYGFQAPQGATSIQVTGFDGNPRSIQLDPTLSVHENADRWFRKAKRAKNGAAEVQDQIVRLSADLDLLSGLLQNLGHYDSLAEIEKAREFAKAHRWLHATAVTTSAKEERPFSGHKIKTLQAPAGYSVLYGENAEANDYLTLRMGRPNDLWLHVRGNTSTHVLIPTSNQPEKVPIEVIRFAANVAARHSPLKHSSYVPVDYTLKKYVRRAKGSAKGMVFYTHEKTIHVDGTE